MLANQIKAAYQYLVVTVLYVLLEVLNVIRDVPKHYRCYTTNQTHGGQRKSRRSAHMYTKEHFSLSESLAQLQHRYHTQTFTSDCQTVSVFTTQTQRIWWLSPPGSQKWYVWSRGRRWWQYALIHLYADYSWLRTGGHAVVATCQSQGRPIRKHTELYRLLYSKMGVNFNKINNTLYWRRLATTDWDHELIRKIFTEVINEIKSRVIFSLAYTQSELFWNQQVAPCSDRMQV